MSAPIHHARQDAIGKIRFMVASGAYVMVRRSGCTPFVMTRIEWMALESFFGTPAEGIER